ncbi:uncharacterized protein H6S33_002713 [Morchella sextelata]|uniref:uncharacterized protein n=1 Tax=Morchella sextelata TaxID=1174677 RepID=UPI001D05005B|nr:uncharacterized protein H6S33_002713 [Morchella sextelata]KAH0607679.1 hypothetical protein H6S33_002713 [Morchella sextelata]
MSGISASFDPGKQPISMGSVKSSSSFSSSSSFTTTSSPSPSPPPSPAAERTIGEGKENIEGGGEGIEVGEESTKKSKHKKKKRGAQARANHEARKKERRSFNGGYSSQSLTPSRNVTPIISGTGSYSATGRQIVQDLFSVYGLPKLNKSFDLNTAVPSWGNQHQINYHNNMSVRRAPVGDHWNLSQRGYYTTQQNGPGNRALSEAVGTGNSSFDDTIMGNTTDGHNNGSGYDDSHDESLYNPTRFTQTYFSKPQELTSPVSDTTSCHHTDSEVDPDLAKVLNPVDRGIATSTELSKIQHLLSNIRIDDYDNQEQVTKSVENGTIKHDECAIAIDRGVEPVERKTEEISEPVENNVLRITEIIQNDSPEVNKLNQCHPKEEATKPIEPVVNETTDSIGWILIGIVEPSEGGSPESIKSGDCKNVEEVIRLDDYVLPEANESVGHKVEEDIITPVESSSLEVTEPAECQTAEELSKPEEYNGPEIIKPTECKAGVETIDQAQNENIELIKLVQSDSIGRTEETFKELHQKIGFEIAHDPSGNEETTIFASEKMLEKLRARMIQEYKERIKDCEAELKDKESALRDEKLISQKKQDCLENYMDITEGLTTKVSELNKSLDLEKKKAEQAIEKEFEITKALTITQEALHDMQTLADIERRKAEDAARKERNATNELDMFTYTFEGLQARVDLEEANTKAATRKEQETAKQLKIVIESFKATKARLEKEETKAKRLAKKESETAKQLKLMTESFKTVQAQASEDKKRAEQAIKKESDTAKQLTIMTESLKEMRATSDKDKKKIEKAARKESDAAKKLEANMETLKEMRVNMEKERMKAKNAAEKEADTVKQLEAMTESLKEVRASVEEEKKKAKSEITRVKKMNKALEKSATEKESKITKELEALKESLKEMQTFIDEEEKKADKAAQREVDTSKQIEVMGKSLQEHVSRIAALGSEKIEMQRVLNELAQQNSFLKAKEEADNELLKNSYKIVRNLKDRFKSFLPRPDSNAAIVKMPVSIVIMANSNIKQLKKLMQTNESIEYEQALARKEKSDAIDSTILKMDTDKMAQDLVLWRAKCKELETKTAVLAKASPVKSIPTAYKTISNPTAVANIDTAKKDSDFKGQAQTTKAKRGGGGGRGGGRGKGKGKRVAIMNVFDFTNGIPEDVNLEDGMRTLLGRASPNFGECSNQQSK